MEAGQAALEEEGAFLDQAEGQLKSNIVGYPESDDDETSNARETDPLTELHRQLSFLRNEFSAEVSAYCCRIVNRPWWAGEDTEKNSVLRGKERKKKTEMTGLVQY